MKPYEAKPAFWRILEKAVTIKVIKLGKYFIVIKKSQ